MRAPGELRCFAGAGAPSRLLQLFDTLRHSPSSLPATCTMACSIVLCSHSSHVSNLHSSPGWVRCGRWESSGASVAFQPRNLQTVDTERDVPVIQAMAWMLDLKLQQTDWTNKALINVCRGRTVARCLFAHPLYSISLASHLL